jgi:hypothetical protein
MLAIALTFSVNAMAGSISNKLVRANLSSVTVGNENSNNSTVAVTLQITYNSENSLLEAYVYNANYPNTNSFGLYTGGCLWNVGPNKGNYQIYVVNGMWDTYVSAYTGKLTA